MDSENIFNPSLFEKGPRLFREKAEQHEQQLAEHEQQLQELRQRQAESDQRFEILLQEIRYLIRQQHPPTQDANTMIPS